MMKLNYLQQWAFDLLIFILIERLIEQIIYLFEQNSSKETILPLFADYGEVVISLSFLQTYLLFFQANTKTDQW